MIVNYIRLYFVIKFIVFYQKAIGVVTLQRQRKRINNSEALNVSHLNKQKKFNDSATIFNDFATIFDGFAAIFGVFVAIFDDFAAIFDDFASILRRFCANSTYTTNIQELYTMIIGMERYTILRYDTIFYDTLSVSYTHLTLPTILRV